IRILGLEVPASEEAHEHTRTSSSISLLTLHRVEDCLARVLLRPHARIAGGEHLPAHDIEFWIWLVVDNRMFPAVWIWLIKRDLAEVIVLFDGGDPDMRIGAADHAKFERIDAELLLKLEAALERCAHIFILEHLRLVRDDPVQVYLVPTPEVSK